MEREVLELLRDRFDRIEKQNDEQLALLRDHIKEDEKVYKVVDRHTLYFKIATLGLPVISGYIAKKLGLVN